jgi:deoxyribonuclease-1-like protein
MRRLLTGLLLLASLAAGGYFLSKRYEFHFEMVERGKGTPAVAGLPQAVPTGDKKTIRVATFNTNPLDERKMAQADVVSQLAKLMRQFDVVALQDVQCRDQGVLVTFLGQVNAEGAHYGYVIPPSVGRDPTEQYLAFLYDQATILVDPTTVYSVVDPGRQFRRAPLVASFRTRGPPPNEAFTFTLINVHTDANRAAEELDVLGEVYRAVRNDGRNEDDIILLGDFGIVDRRFGPLGRLPHVTPAVPLESAAAGGLRLADNVLFDRQATVEFTSQAGVTDLMRQFSRSAPQAAELSTHLPVWAEFSVYEGGAAQR